MKDIAVINITINVVIIYTFILGFIEVQLILIYTYNFTKVSL